MGNQQPVNGSLPSGDTQGRTNPGGQEYTGAGGNYEGTPAHHQIPGATGYAVGGGPYDGTNIISSSAAGGGGGSSSIHPPQYQSHHNVPPSQNTAAYANNNNRQQLPPNLQHSTSDASMTIMDGESTTNAVLMNQPGSGGIDEWLDDDTVPTVFRWEHGGRNVYITGTFNGWSRQIPMHRSGNDFTYIHNLKRGKHAFKFIVDDEWRYAPDQPTVADIEGRINNFIDVTSFKPYTGDKDFEREKAAAEYGVLDTDVVLDGESSATNEEAGGPDRDGEVFSHNMPDVYDYTKEPPPLPPHLRHIILNKPPQLQDTSALPVPQHVALNHLYCTAIRDNMMVLGITQRYKNKYVTTVYYSPCASK
jgi:5'-AMP-activated protein kinase, regulatory beta subunit